jgi:import inner membrane translocase subunit TIM44
MKSRPAFLRSMRLRNVAAVPTLPPRSALVVRPSNLTNPASAFRTISTSSRWLNEAKPNSNANTDGTDNTAGAGKDGQDGKDGKDAKGKSKPRFEENAAPQSPWKVFVQTLREEIDKTQGFADNVKQLQGEVDKAADSEAMKKARALYEKTRVSDVLSKSIRQDFHFVL